ncbi:TetR/AcrR family transcriptional regulator [Catenovulum sp. 2E275]|uniref:TetR/AcrR family transcriptional regulator n=1 Tax=Catenovulum sp. 2E275 TaxID=2980497 RepID=UPI0021D1510F|nr:TetR/AcrR family transcriptional regulator [Catenovulum sp. 2E275]MCU4676056.1 TetR/AcrR family transcriptional regulator [Catenovulum sp. 2E275]
MSQIVEINSEPTKQNKKELARQKSQALILDAAERLFSSSGYDGASMNAIANEANVPKANVLYYFKSKDNLYEAVLERILSNWNLGLIDISVNDDPAVALYKYIYLKVRLACEQPMQSRLFATEIIRGAPYLGDYIRNNTRPWFRKKIEVLQAWIDANKIAPVDPTHLLFMIWSSTQYYADYQTEILILQNKLEYEESDIQAITRSIAQLILGGLGLKLPENR